MSGRSYELITVADLRRLGEIASLDRQDFFRRKVETGALYADRLFAVALCQGAALHFLDGKNGIKDFDVWSFFQSRKERSFPYRRRAKVDFGDPKFGTTDDGSNFVGRRVDLIGRSIDASDVSDPIAVLRIYLRAAKTPSAHFLSQKAMILIEPTSLIGTKVWPN
jgi:hypothetical protein